MIRYYFNFISSGHGRVELEQEPTGIDAAEFVIEQEEGRKGRDVAYAAGENRLSIYSLSHARTFDIMQYNMHKFGFNAKVKFEIEFGDDLRVIGDVDFPSCTTDKSTYFEFLVIEDGERAIFKRRYDINTNLFSTTDLNGNPITPCQTERVLVKAKPVIQISEWSNPQEGRQMNFNNPAANANYFMPIKNQVVYDIKDSLTWFEDVNTDSEGGFENFIFIDAATNFKDIKIEFEFDAVYDYLPNLENDFPDKAGQILLRIYYGQEASPGNYSQISAWNSIAFTGTTNQQQILPINLSRNIDSINSTDKIWISFVSATNNGAVNRVTFNKCVIKITATSIAMNTVVPMVRLINAMKYNGASAAGLVINAPRWDEGGELFDQYITTTPLLRNLTDKPFNITTKKIVEDYLRPEANGDFQIQEDGFVLYGGVLNDVDDFYKPYQVAYFGQEQFQSYQHSFNDKLKCNRFRFLYKNYASQKEAEQANTYDVVHGESEWLLKTDNVQNTKQAEVGFIRDAFYIEQARRKAYDFSDTSATQDDDKIYILDVMRMQNNNDRVFKETASLQHNADGGFLTLTNDASFSFILLGIIEGTLFTIINGANAGAYSVVQVADTTIKLLSSGPPPEDITAQNTTFTYNISPLVTSLMIRTSQGFSEIENIEDGNNYANLRYTIKRNIIKRYSSFLASCLLRASNKTVTNTLYNNNPAAITQIIGEDLLQESFSFIPQNPILDTGIHNTEVVMSLKEFLDLRTGIRQHNGYITILDPTGLPIKGYVKSAKWTFDTDGRSMPDDMLGVMEAVLEEKYEQFLVTLFGTGDGVVIMNNDTPIVNMRFEIDEYEKLHIFDETGKRQYPGVPFNRVKVNSSTEPAVNTVQLTQWINAIL